MIRVTKIMTVNKRVCGVLLLENSGEEQVNDVAFFYCEPNSSCTVCTYTYLVGFCFCFVLPLGIASAIAKFTVESERPSKARQPVLPVGMVLLCYSGRLKGKIRSASLVLTRAHSLTCIKIQ